MRTIGCVLVLHALLFTSTAFAQSGVSLPEIDRMCDEGRYGEALAALEELHQPGNADVLWRLARTRVDLGEEAASEEEQQQHYRAALAEARRAVEADDRNAQAHLARAIAAGRVALLAGNREKVELSREVKESADRTIELDPENDAAYHVRARWHYEVADLGFFERAALKVVYGGLPEASFEQAARDLQKAIAIDDVVRHQVELGKVYVKLGQEARARAALQRALERPEAYPDDARYKQEARVLLEGLD